VIQVFTRPGGKRRRRRRRGWVADYSGSLAGSRATAASLPSCKQKFQVAIALGLIGMAKKQRLSNGLIWEEIEGVLCLEILQLYRVAGNVQVIYLFSSE